MRIESDFPAIGNGIAGLSYYLVYNIYFHCTFLKYNDIE